MNLTNQIIRKKKVPRFMVAAVAGSTVAATSGTINRAARSPRPETQMAANGKQGNQAPPVSPINPLIANFALYLKGAKELLRASESPKRRR